MPRLLAFGNNICRALDSRGTDIIDCPRDVTQNPGCDKVLWHSWTCTISRNATGHLVVWGTVTPQIRRSIESTKAADVVKILGHDEPLGFLSQHNAVHAFSGQIHNREWRDVAVDDTGRVYALNKHSIVIFVSWTSFLSGQSVRDIGHPLFERASSLTIHALESRCFVQMDTHLLEIKDDSLRLVDAVDGLGFRIVEGRRNRLGVITDAGDAFVFCPKSQEPSLIDVADEVRFLGLGSEFDIVVTQSKVLARGNSKLWNVHTDDRLVWSAGESKVRGRTSSLANCGCRCGSDTGLALRQVVVHNHDAVDAYTSIIVLQAASKTSVMSPSNGSKSVMPDRGRPFSTSPSSKIP